MARFPCLCVAVIQALAPIPVVVKIDGRWRDVSSWVDSHPGGRHTLRWVHGFDVTALYHSIHLFGRRAADASLARLPVLEGPEPKLPELPDPTVVGVAAARAARTAARGHPESALRRDLEALLRSKFANRADYKASGAHWAGAAGALAATALCFRGYAAASPAHVLALPWCCWLLFSYTVHEGTHSTLSTVPWVNRWAMFCGHPYVLNAYTWFHQHQVSHHQFTNDEVLDVDLHHLRPATQHPKLARDAGASGVDFLLKAPVTTVGMSVLWPLRALFDWRTPRYTANVTPKPLAVTKRALALSLLPTAAVLLYPPALALSGGASKRVAALMFFYPWLVTSCIWTVLTQSSHIQEDCQRDRTDDDFYRWQIESALDYSRHSRLVPALTAGLNYQTLHHVFPCASPGVPPPICSRTRGRAPRPAQPSATATSTTSTPTTRPSAPRTASASTRARTSSPPGAPASPASSSSPRNGSGTPPI